MTIEFNPGTKAYPFANLIPLDIEPARTVCSRRFSRILARVVAFEFVLVAGTAYLASAIYNRIVLLRWPPTEEYVTAALFIAAAVMAVSLGFRHFAAFQAQPRHRILWNAAGAVALAFSFFLSALFLLKGAEGYSRGTFVFQFAAVGVALLTARALLEPRLGAAIAAGRLEARRGVLIGAFLLLSLTDPACSPLFVAIGAVLVAAM
jgi:hypothetical protein